MKNTVRKKNATRPSMPMVHGKDVARLVEQQRTHIANLNRENKDLLESLVSVTNRIAILSAENKRLSAAIEWVLNIDPPSHSSEMFQAELRRRAGME